MRSWYSRACVGLVLMVLLGGCAPGSPTGQGASAPVSGIGAAAPVKVKRITASMMGEPPSFVLRMNPGQITAPGAAVLEQLVNASLSEVNAERKLQPLLAEAVPSLENGLWKLLPDGRMETTWRIKRGARWHDGTPLTGEDMVFTTTVDQDRDVPLLRPTGYAFVESVEAPDSQTVTVRWNRPYIDADTMFTQAFASPLPRHLLEDTYNTDKARFPTLSYWNHEFVGSGPFMVRELAPGSSVSLQANDGYVLGRPKIDEIEIRFILDLNTLMTNVVSGAIDLTLGRGFAIEQALQLRDQWRDGRLDINPRAWIAIHPQFVNPSPAAVGELQFRRALLHATDRQQLVDTLQGGITSIAHLMLGPGEPEYREVEDSVVRYEYDLRRAAQLIEGLGLSRGPDGVFRDSGAGRLALELRSNGEPITEKTVVPVANMWTQLGVATEPLIVPPQRIIDREYMATFPGFRMMRQPNIASDVNRSRSSLTPLPENRFVGSNYARYVSAEFDALIDRFLTTIPRAERMQALRQVMHHISENLNLMGVFYDGEFTFLHNRMQDVTARETQISDAHKWDVKS